MLVACVLGRGQGCRAWSERHSTEMSPGVEGGKELQMEEPRPGPSPILTGHDGVQDHLGSPELKLLSGLILCFVLFVLLSPKWIWQLIRKTVLSALGSTKVVETLKGSLSLLLLPQPQGAEALGAG